METIDAMLGGPGRFRFILQPLIAVLLGIRDGRKDAKAGLPPYVLTVIFEPERRKEELLSGLKTLTKPLILAVLIDLVLQYFIFKSVRLWQALVVGAVLIALPYSIARGLTNRFMQRRKQRHQANLESSSPASSRP